MATPRNQLEVNPAQSATLGRMLFIDNVRWTMILLVISMHAADTYSPLGSWYFTDRKPISTPVLLTFAAWQMYLQSFFMGLLFFIAGYFVPASFDRKGPRKFLSDRAFRLGLPVLFYMFVLGPITEYFVAHSWTSTLPTSFVNEWIKHIRNGEFLQENGPLWFCLALLIFAAVYVLLRILRSSDSVVLKPAPGTATLIGFSLGMASFSFFVRAFRPPTVLNMHLPDFPQYILLFSAGILAARHHWIQRFSFKNAMRWIAIVLPAGFAGWLALLLYGGALSGHRGYLSGGWHWQNAAFCLWESFTCVAISYGLLVLYREKFPGQKRGAKFMSDNAFSVYVFHPPIVILAARMLTAVSWHPLLKFIALAIIATAVSFALSELVFRRIPLLRTIL